MKRVILAAAAFAMLGAGAAKADPREDAAALYVRLNDPKLCAAALPDALAQIRTPAFDALAADLRGQILYKMMDCGWDNDAGDAAMLATEKGRALGAPWASGGALINVALRFDRDERALAEFTTLAPEQVRDLHPWTVWGLLRVAREKEDKDAALLAAHAKLQAAAYLPPGGNDDQLRLDHGRALLRAGDVAAARERLTGIVSPQSVLEMRVAKLFEPLRADPAFAANLDIAAAAQAHLARARAAMRANPRRIQPVLETAQTLRALGRDEEALAELRTLLRRADSRMGPTLFDDYDDQINWALNEQAYVLMSLGRAEEARQSMRDAIEAGDVSQRINFASLLYRDGRDREALESLSDMGEASPYGDMWAANVRACVGEAASNRRLRDEALAFLRAHADDNPAALTASLLCVNDLDGAAASYVRRLANPEQSGDALTALQIYEPDPRVSARSRALLQRLDRVRERPDVRAAVDAVGRIERVPLRATYWGDV